MSSLFSQTDLPDHPAADRLRPVPRWLRNPAGAFIVIAFLFGLLGTATLAAEIGRPFPGYITYGFIDRPRVILGQDTPSWWPVWQVSELQIEDELLTINGQPYPNHMWSEVAQAHARGLPVEVSIYRPDADSVFTYTVPTRLFTLPDFVDLKFPELLVGISFWLLAVIVLRAKPDSVTNRVFAAATAAVALHRMTAVTSLAMDARLLPNIPKTAHLLAAGLVTALIFHMAFRFPSPLARKTDRVLWVVYSLGILSGVILAASRLPFWAALPYRLDLLLDEVTYRVMMLLLLLGMITLFARLIWVWFHSGRGRRRDRRVARIVLAGLIFALPPVLSILGPAIPGMGQEFRPFWESLDLRYMLLAVPISFALAIIRYQAFQSPSPLFIFAIVLSSSALLASVAVAVLSFSLGDTIVSPGRLPFQTIFLLLLGATFFWSRQTEWRGWFGRYLHRQERNYESARSFGSRIMDRYDLSSMPASMAQALADELELEWAGVWLWRPDRHDFELAAMVGEIDTPPPRYFPADPMLARPRPFHVAWPETSPRLRDLAAGGRLEILVPLVMGGVPVGLLGLGRRWDEEIFDERDMAILELVGQQATLFIQAALQVEELRQVPGLVAEAQERERFRLASELHDTVQQFLGRLPFFLTVSRDLMTRDSAQAAALLDRSIGDVEEASRVLRAIRANLAPNQLETSLVKPLARLAEYVENQAGLSIRLDAPDDLDAATTSGTRHALYRVIQQALDNAAAHAEASEVVVALNRDNGRVQFTVADNGCGSSDERRDQARAEGSFGLLSMRARIEAVGGEFAFDSSPERGTTVSGWVPASG